MAWNIQDYDPRGLNLRFYERYDADFLASKAYVLNAIIHNLEDFSTLFAQYETTLEEGDVARFSSEIYFTEFHQFEALFALLIAPFQSQIHWLYLTEYRTQDLKNHMESFLSDDFASITGGLLATASEFLGAALYNNLLGPEKLDEWDANVNNMLLILKQFAEKYLNSTEYNAYKHGVRALTGPWAVELNLDPDTKITQESDSGFRYLEITKDKEGGGKILRETFKVFDTEDSMNRIAFIHSILKTVRMTRLATFRGDKEVNAVILPEIDMAQLNKFRPNVSSFSISIGGKSRD